MRLAGTTWQGAGLLPGTEADRVRVIRTYYKGLVAALVTGLPLVPEQARCLARTQNYVATIPKERNVGELPPRLWGRVPVRTATAPTHRFLRRRKWRETLAAQIFTSSNPLISWLRQLDALRRVA